MIETFKLFSDKVDRFTPIIARVLIALLFLFAAWSKISIFSQVMASFNQLPILPGLVWILLALTFELGGAIFLLVGYKTRLASYALIVFTIMTIIIGHINWASSPIQFQLVDILKNLAIIGGLFLTAKHGADCCSFDKKFADTVVTPQI